MEEAVEFLNLLQGTKLVREGKDELVRNENSKGRFTVNSMHSSVGDQSLFPTYAN